MVLCGFFYCTYTRKNENGELLMIKKLLSLALVLTLMASLTFANTANAIDPQYETIKIGINYGSSGKSLVGISSPNGFKVGYMNGSQFVHLYDMTETYLDVAYASATTIKINGSTYDISNGNYAFSPNSGSVNIAGTLYRGGVEFLPNSSGLLNVINFVNINDYIAAVVGKEMSPSWNIEALKAQAVCARTFSLYNWNKHSSHGFNLCGTQDCQAYLGVSGESESTVRAANETLNQVITYNGKVITAVYSSSNGGSSAYSKYVWGGDLPYLQAVNDIYENQEETSNSPWQVTITNADIHAKLSKKGINIGDIQDMRITGADEYGRSYEVTIYGSNGTHVLKNDATRSFFGFRSQKYTISSGNVSSVVAGPPAPVKTEENSGSVHAVSSAGKAIINAYNAVSPGGIFAAPKAMYVIGVSGKQSINTEPVQTVPPVAIQPDIAPGTYVINGTGWGHGVGMSQWGAKAMADKGFSYADIISFYYKGTSLQY